MPSSSLTCPCQDCIHLKMAPCPTKCKVKWTSSTRRSTRRNSRYLSCRLREGSKAWISNHRLAWPTAVITHQQTLYHKMVAHRKRSLRSTELTWVHPKRSSCSINNQALMKKKSLRAYEFPRNRPALVLIKTTWKLPSTNEITLLKLWMVIRALCHHNMNY